VQPRSPPKKAINLWLRPAARSLFFSETKSLLPGGVVPLKYWARSFVGMKSCNETASITVYIRARLVMLRALE